MIQLRLLGALDLTDASGAPMDAALRRTKPVALLAYLVVARPLGFHRRDKIAALFWPELNTERARAALRVTLTRLRDILGDDVILTRGDDIAVESSRVSCDVVMLDQALSRGDALDAAALYHGPFLDGVHVDGTDNELEQWIEAERTRIRDDLLRALLDAAGDGNLDAARRAVEVAPVDEDAARRLIALFIANSDRGGALRAYEDLERRLRSTFEVAPSPATRALIAPFTDERQIAPSPPPSAPSSSPLSRPSLLPPLRSPLRLLLSVGAGLILLGVAGAAVARARTSETAALRWSQIHESSDTRPSGRLGAAALLDSTGDAILYFGGADGGAASGKPNLSNDLWRLHGLGHGETAVWMHVAVADRPKPAPRWLFGATYDAPHDRMLVYGGALGATSPCTNDTWILDHASGVGAVPRWRKVRIADELPPPPPRGGIAIHYDPASRRMLFFGGHDCVATYFHDVWILTFDDSTLSSGRWTRLKPDSSAGLPYRRIAYASALDTKTNRLIVHGGNDFGHILRELWVLEHANGLGGVPAWRPLVCDGGDPILADHASAFDSTSGSMFFFGGLDSTETQRRDSWRLTGLRDAPGTCRWENLKNVEPGPNARGHASLMLDARHRRVVLFGGEAQNTAFSDTWITADPFRKP
jgi:DNA-binding SARP family transcriptional activator